MVVTSKITQAQVMGLPGLVFFELVFSIKALSPLY